MEKNLPLTIKSGSFVCTLDIMESLLDLQISKVRKLLEIMFSAECENRETIKAISDWLPKFDISTTAASYSAQTNLGQVAQYVNALRSKMAAFGSLLTKEQRVELKEASATLRYAQKQARNAKRKHERVQKLQSIFNKFKEEY